MSLNAGTVTLPFTGGKGPSATTLGGAAIGSLSLRDLLLHGCAVAAPRLFHVTIKALTVDQGRSSKAEIS